MSEVIIPDGYRKVRQCSICRHPDVDNIDKELVKGTTFSELSRRYNQDYQAFSRHYRKHLMPVIEETIGVQSLVYGDNLIKEIERYRKKTEELLQKAEDAGEFRALPAYLREIREQLKFIAELEGRIFNSPQVNILINNPEWIQLRSLIFSALEPYPEARMAVLNALRTYIRSGGSPGSGGLGLSQISDEAGSMARESHPDSETPDDS